MSEQDPTLFGYRINTGEYAESQWGIPISIFAATLIDNTLGEWLERSGRIPYYERIDGALFALWGSLTWSTLSQWPTNGWSGITASLTAVTPYVLAGLAVNRTLLKNEFAGYTAGDTLTDSQRNALIKALAGTLSLGIAGAWVLGKFISEPKNGVSSSSKLQNPEEFGRIPFSRPLSVAYMQ